MTDIVYAIGKGSLYDNFELRMSLRSLENLSNIRNVYIVGEKPHWIQNVNHIHYPDSFRIPDQNICDKISTACRLSELSDDFLFMNDDHYILKKFDATTFPYFYSKTIEEYIASRPRDPYGIRVRNMLDHLKKGGYPENYYDVHTPILYNKAAFLKHVTDSLDWNVNQAGAKHGYVIKSIYANKMNVKPVKYMDQKSNIPPAPSVQVFSSLPHMRESVKRFLYERFPVMSRFERMAL